MNNVIKAVFIAMLENVGADYNDDMLNRLVEAYLKADKDVGEVKFIRQEVLDKAMKDHDDFEDYYDLECIEVIPNEVYNEFDKNINGSQKSSLYGYDSGSALFDIIRRL
jgi:hypothetical protein